MKTGILLLLSLISLSSFGAAKDLYALFSPHQGAEAFEDIYSKVKGAKESVYATVYSWSDSNATKAFLEALENGATVRIVLHTSLAKKSRVKDYVQKLEAAGAEVKIAKMNMHEKFFIIDNKFLVNSSANLSTGAKTKYSENFIFSNDKTAFGLEMLDQFNDEFAILWNSGKDIITNGEENASEMHIVDTLNLPEEEQSYFLSSSMNYTMRKNKVTSRDYLAGKYIKLSRKGGTKNQTWVIRDTIIDEIKKAKKNVYLSLNHLNIRDISDALIEAVKRGIDVKLAVDNQEYKSYPNGKEMTPQFVADWKKIKGNSRKEAPVRVKYYSHNPSPRYWFLNHHKYLVVDYDESDFSKTTLISGSYNLSKTAEHNQFDNMVVYKGVDKKELFKSFKGEFDRLWFLNRDESDKPNEKAYNKFITPYKESISLHSNESVSLKWSEVKKLRRKVNEIAPGIFKGSYRNRDCKFYSIKTKKFWACPKK